MSRGVANDDAAAISADPEALALEIERLRNQIAQLQTRVEQLDVLAHRDPLVDLPNRRSFLATLDGLIARLEHSKEPAAVLFVDVDGLKAINDKLGHQAGDAALVEVAALLVASTRKHDCVARIGGDEFGILLEQADELSAWLMALRVVETVVGAKFCLGTTTLPLSVAVGVATIQPGDDSATVMARADREMYRVKAA
jgi:diguanylate cyclase (GGDEF)-like protein